MKTKQIPLKTCILFLLLIIPGTLSLARGTATMMGDLKTVSTDGPFDAIRNPAAMAFRGTSAGINFFFSPWTADGNEVAIKSISAIINGTPMVITNTQTDSSIEKKTIMNQEFATSIKISDMFFLGLGVTAFFKNQENLLKQLIQTGGGDLGRTISTNSDTTAYSTCFSLGIKLTETISMGYALNFSIGNEENNFTEASVSPSGNNNSSGNTSIGTISGELSAYFMHKTDSHQTGVNFYSGKYSWIDYSVQKDGGGSYDTKFSGSYSNGAALIAGHYWRFTPLIAVAFEAGAVIPIKYTAYNYKNIVTPTNYLTDKHTVLNGLTVLASTGVEINPLKKLTTAFGISYTYTMGGNRQITSFMSGAADSDYSDQTTNYHGHVVSTNAGLTYEILAGMEINFAASFSWIGLSVKQENFINSVHTDTMLIVFDVDTESNIYQLDFVLSFVKKI